MKIDRRYGFMSKEGLPKEPNIFKRLLCKHDLVDDIICSEMGFTRISGEDHIIYCKKCGHIKGYWSKDYD